MKQSTRSVLLTALLTAAALGAGFAQDTPPPDAPPPAAGHGGHDGVARRVDFLTQKLGLTDAQKAQVAEILTQEEKRERKLHEETKAKIDAVLTPEQLATLAALHPHGHKGQGQTPPPPANP